jgi:catechol 2,3-dioxygenase-like lactoylglutathione lyase family enzyme
MSEINHIGLTVGNIDAAVTFYTSVFGLEVLVAPGAHTLDTPAGERRRDVFGDRWGGMKLAHLTTPSGAGLELFEFIEPETIRPEEGFAYWRTGVSHICFTVADIDDTICTLIKAGGRKRSEIHTVRPGTQVCYCEDPWGSVVEVSSGTYTMIVGKARADNQA